MATTAFADIQRLPPAHTLECMGDTLSVRPYWTLSAPSEVKYNRPEEYVEHFNELLDLAVGDRLRDGKCQCLDERRPGFFHGGGQRTASFHSRRKKATGRCTRTPKFLTG